MAKSTAYWKNRFSAVESMMHRRSVTTLGQITPAFDSAQAQIQKEIESWYQRFANNNQISLQEAKVLLNNKELKELKWDIDEYIKYGRQNAIDPQWMKELENASAKYHISRLEALQIRTQNAAERAFGNETDALDSLLEGIYTDDYYHTAYEIQKGLGIGFDIGQIDQKRLDRILKKPWTADAQTFSDRIWKSKAQLLDAVDKNLTQMCILGGKPDDAIKNISHALNVSKAQAGRLVMTESAYFASEAQKECFEDLDVEMYEILATLDSRTSEICQQMDGKHFPMKDYQAGVTAPPFHPWCRSTTIPYFDDEWGREGTRAARGADGKTYQVPASMKYSDWKKGFVDGGSKNSLNITKNSNIVKPTIIKKEDSNVQTVGNIDIEKYRCITENITTDEVIITPERIQHIEDHHPNTFDKISPYLQSVLDSPDYILEDKNPNTGLILKVIENEGIRIQVVLRVHTSSDPVEYKNSIISTWDISESRWNNYIKNKKILYKRE